MDTKKTTKMKLLSLRKIQEKIFRRHLRSKTHLNNTGEKLLCEI